MSGTMQVVLRLLPKGLTNDIIEEGVNRGSRRAGLSFCNARWMCLLVHDRHALSGLH